MRTHLEFVSAQFPPYPEEDEEINPGRYGKRLAEFLAAQLPAHGFPVAGIGLEDWGVRVDLENEDYPLWLGCGNYEEFPDGFLVFIEPSQAYVRRWLKRIPTASTVERLAAAVEAALKATEGVSRLRWWDEGEARA